MTKQQLDQLFLALGVLGAFIVCYGYLQASPSTFYIIGSFALLLTAFHFKLIYFIALECILMACHASGMLGISFYTQIALPILLCLQLLIIYVMLGKQNSVFLLIGILGIALLSIGFASNSQWMYFIGSGSVSIYAIYCVYRRNYPALIWAVLNSIFAVAALYRLLLI